MIGFFLNPINRLLAITAAVLAAVAAIYGKGRRDARKIIEGEANADVLRRTQSAIRAGDHAAVSSERLRDNDGHKRD